MIGPDALYCRPSTPERCEGPANPIHPYGAGRVPLAVSFPFYRNSGSHIVPVLNSSLKHFTHQKAFVSVVTASLFTVVKQFIFFKIEGSLTLVD